MRGLSEHRTVEERLIRILIEVALVVEVGVVEDVGLHCVVPTGLRLGGLDDLLGSDLLGTALARRGLAECQLR